jgi:hypothetical protein
MLALASDGADAEFAVHSKGIVYDCALRAVNRELEDRGRIITHRRDVIIPHH